jgi:hypothetical protein
MADTVLEAVLQELGRACEFNSGTQVAPIGILWTDSDRVWEPFVPAVLEAHAAFLSLGDYQPDERIGPAIWIRCMLARTLPAADWPEETVPVVYLPGVSRSDLRAIDSCPQYLQPLAELQYRGVVWSQLNGKDWTPFAFLKSQSGGLGLDVAGDDRTLDALQNALPRLAATPVRRLRGHRLEAPDFLELVRPEVTKDLLHWISDPEGTRARLDDAEWKAFRSSCMEKYGIDPDSDGPLVAAERVGRQSGPWGTVWRRFREAPTLYGGIPDRLRQAAPSKLDPQDMFANLESWPQFNEAEEADLRKALVGLEGEMREMAAKRVREMEERHGRRRGWVWTELGKAPLARALMHLAEVVEHTETDLTGSDAEQLAKGYVESGWRADAAAIRSLAAVEIPEDRVAVVAALRAIYVPWLAEGANHFQARLGVKPMVGKGAMETIEPLTGECILFADGLRFDVGMMLVEALRDAGLEVGAGYRWAALPTVTATAKPAASPIAGMLSGDSQSTDFCPTLEGGEKPLTIDRFRKMLTGAGIQVLSKDEIGDPGGRGWTEHGAIDRRGHDEEIGLAHRIDEEVRGLAGRIRSLLAAGWARVRVVSDHGWLLVPGGLPKVELPGYLAEARWGRCAVMKPSATTDLPSFAWHWAPEVHIATPHGIGSFIAGKEYAHGGLSVQECVTPVLSISAGASAKAFAQFESVQWRGMRCRIEVSTTAKDLRADLRVKPADASTSIISAPKALDDGGEASLVVPDDSYEGSTVTLVLLDEQESVIAKQSTTVGGDA